MTMTEDVTELMTEHSRWHNFLPGIPRQVMVFTGVESNGIRSEGCHTSFRVDLELMFIFLHFLLGSAQNLGSSRERGTFIKY